MSTSDQPTDSFWDSVTGVQPSANEAEVEHRIVVPLLAALGFELEDVAAKVPVELTQGTKRGRPFEADFVVYSAALHDRDTSLMVVEAKSPGKSLEDARKQGESYAMALRASTLLLTDGVILQVWQLQPTLENRQVFTCPISELRARRGEVEQIVGKQALVAHAQTLANKKLTAIPDFGGYESAELARTQGADRAISRVLLLETGETVTSDQLLGAYIQGAVISAPSGYGKTTMASQLLRHGIKRRWRDEGAALPIDIPLVDLGAGAPSLIEFVQARIVAHHPQVTTATVRDVARSCGLLLICDGYERIEPQARPALESQLRQLIRDFPKSQVFVFSRGSVAPQLALPRLQLQSLSHEERQELAERFAGEGFSLSLMPRLLVELSEIPLILERIIAFWKTSRIFPTRLEELFEHWLRQLLGDPSAAPAAVALRSKVLLAFARELGIRSLTPPEALDLTIVSGGDGQTFDGLVQCGALLVSTTSVEFVHEGLADHLRARALATLPETELRAVLSTMKIDEDSLLPVLLAALARDAASRAYVWERLREMALPRYIDAIRFSEGADEPFTASHIPLAERRFVEDMATSIESLVDAFFPSIAAELRGCLASQLGPINGLCLVGKIAVKPTSALYYSLRPADTNSVQIEPPSPKGPYSFVTLTTCQLGVHDGRYMGAVVTRDALSDLVQNRRFHGGSTLANERTIGRLRFMQKEYGFQVDPQESLSDLLQRLRPIADTAVIAGPSRGSAPSFVIASMIEDLELLQSQGAIHLDWWWLQYGSHDEMFADHQRMEGFLREHYKRAVALYSEVVSTSFNRVSNSFSLFKVTPMRWQIAVVPPSRQWHVPTQYWRWLPVETEGESGVDVMFCDAPPDDFIRDDQHQALLAKELGRFGRNVSRYFIGGMAIFPSTGTREINGLLTGETSAMREAISYLEADVKDLFGDLPHIYSR